MKLRSPAFAPMILAVIACAAACERQVPKADLEGPLFDRLTAHAWDNNAPGMFGHTEQLTLRRDGTYHWQRESDVVERDQSGTWSLVASGASTGVARLSASGDLPFEFVGQKLRLGEATFVRGDPIVYTEREREIVPHDLKPVAARETTRRLAATAWVKTNPFDDYRLPDRIEFSAHGRYTAWYRGGDCRHGGLWGLEYHRDDRIELVGWADDNQCDQRGGSAGLPHTHLAFSGDLLLLDACYAPADRKPSQSIFIFDRYGNSLRTRGQYAGRLTAGRTVKIEFTHESVGGGDYALKSLEIGFQKQKIVKGGSAAEGELEWVLRHDLSGNRVQRDAPYRYTVEVTPPFSGQGWFCIRPIYANTSQPFDAYESYMTTIAE